MLIATDREWLHKGVIRCIVHECPMTLTYTKEDGSTTIRTVEPYSLDRSEAGNVLIRALDRESKKPRTFRADRIQKYTVHTRGKWLLDHSPLKEVS